MDQVPVRLGWVQRHRGAHRGGPATGRAGRPEHGPTRGRGAAAGPQPSRRGAGAAHRREVELSETTLRITDTIQGFSEKAVLRWRLSPNLAWHETSSGAKCDKVEFTVRCTAPPIKQALNCGWESRYYYKKTALPVFEVEVGEASQIFTEFRWIN